MIKCIIIDTGVDRTHPLIDQTSLDGFSVLHNDNNELEISENYDDTYGHGTAIYHILQGLNKQVSYISIKIPSIENETVSEDILIDVLNYIYDNLNVDLINLSLGITVSERSSELYQICKKLDDNGTVIFSAYDNDGAMSYPAVFDCVIGVVGLDKCIKKNDYIYIEDTCINIAAKGNIQRLAWHNPRTVFMSGNSFACAHAARKALEFMIEGAQGRQQIIEKFKSTSSDIFYIVNKRQHANQDWVNSGRVALFPFNKEMHSLVRFCDSLQFEIAKIYDTKYSGIISSSTSAIMNDSSIRDYRIENIDDIDYDAFDSFIFGHFVEQEALLPRDFRKKLLDNLSFHKKRVFSFDDINEIGLSYDNVFCPKIAEDDVPPNRMGKLYRINRPVLGVFGTSSQQGKFTLQLIIRDLLHKAGYSVGQIGSEPHSELFGMDYSFPFGYNQSVYVRDDDVLLYLNSAIHSLCDENDIIIVGSQANTIPYDYGNLDRYMLRQHLFFVGTQPDAVVLVINPYDEQEYVEHTIQYIESFGFCKVIAITIFPMDFDDGWKRFTQKKCRLSSGKFNSIKQRFSIPVYLLGDENDMSDLFSCIIDYFS